MRLSHSGDDNINATCRFEIFSHSVAWLFPVPFTLIPLLTRDFENLGGYCWISELKWSGKINRYTVHILPVWFCFLVLTSFIILISIYLVKLQRETMRLLIGFDRRVGMLSKSSRAYVLMVSVLPIKCLACTHHQICRVGYLLYFSFWACSQQPTESMNL